ncbi:MAG: TIM barrel protein [Oscillospiraceae bacterium]|nr:TIM barrel protein [Oscillospiraceae bacterium]
MIQRETALFGSGGNPQRFYDDGFKETADVFKWLKQKNIDSYEYQAGSGLRVSSAVLKKIGEAAAVSNIVLSLHAPYYISLASDDDEIIARSVSHVLKSVDAAAVMGAAAAVVHCGGLGKKTREQALEKSRATLEKILENLYESNQTDIKIGLETMGKINQLGTLEEVIELCKLDTKILEPVVDFGHLHAREKGERFKTYGDYYKVFELVGENLSDYAAKYLHCHFSKIEYTVLGGEKKHLTFEDKTFGPEFLPLAAVLCEHKLFPNIICESDKTMDTDALYMKQIYKEKQRKELI